MNEVQRSKIILKILNKIYPKTPIPLKHRNKFTLLVSVLLWGNLSNISVLFCIYISVSFGLLGALDDYKKNI